MGRCDCQYETGWTDDCLSGDPPDAHDTTTFGRIEEAARNRDDSERIVDNPVAPQGMPVVALTVGTTSRGFRWDSFDVSPLFGILLPSLLRTLEEGFDFRWVAKFSHSSGFRSRFVPRAVYPPGIFPLGLALIDSSGTL